jgi:hypothetical protein
MYLTRPSLSLPEPPDAVFAPRGLGHAAISGTTSAAAATTSIKPGVTANDVHGHR